eukprot:TRINITY_DN936_c0_g2_i1.p1 TRINITY_DN936_c0_g2~~TRINITY_DN936_c0_g2_i1.p1  ORF type:complete len:209 (+),score=20.88 TRINITY_DN936_c0_g2_i1:24-629(+)
MATKTVCFSCDATFYGSQCTSCGAHAVPPQDQYQYAPLQQFYPSAPGQDHTQTVPMQGQVQYGQPMQGQVQYGQPPVFTQPNHHHHHNHVLYDSPSVVVVEAQSTFIPSPRSKFPRGCLLFSIVSIIFFVLLAIIMPVVIVQQFQGCIQDGVEDWFEHFDDPSSKCYYVPIMSYVMVVSIFLASVCSCIACCSAFGVVCSR